MTKKPWLNNSLAANDRPICDNFRDWFGSSRAVSDAGVPLVLFHGTSASFDSFLVGVNDNDEVGAFFTTNGEAAEDYGDRVIQAYVSIQKPYDVTASQWSEADGLSPQEAKDQGYDGYIIRGQDIGGGKDGEDTIHSAVGDTFIIFRPDQVKSIDNCGLFLSGNDEMRDSRAAASLLNAARARDVALQGLARGVSP